MLIFYEPYLFRKAHLILSIPRIRLSTPHPFKVFTHLMFLIVQNEQILSFYSYNYSETTNENVNT